jgi:hypothetical protein
MSGGRVRWEQSELFRNARDLPRKIDEMVALVIEYHSSAAQAYMRHNAPWRDQTSNARNGLKATTMHVPFKSHSIILSHGVPYGIWLEVRFSGKNAIITPTQKAMGPLILQMIGTRWGPTVSAGGRGSL